jgi:hypothetical protein
MFSGLVPIQELKVGFVYFPWTSVPLSYSSVGGMFVLPKVIDLCYVIFSLEAAG